MTLPRLYEFGRSWADHPPTHLLLGAFLGVKPALKQDESKGNLSELIGELSAAGVKMEGPKNG
jgi:hypothetical protein